MLEQIVSFVLKYKFIFLFYLVVVIFLLSKRKKLERQAKILVLYRMKWGLKFMENFARKHRSLVLLFGYIGVGAGYLGLIFISYILVKNLWDLVVKPTAISGVSLVLPGVKVPGLGVLPFWYWLAAIFVIALIHEFAHGIVARVWGIPVKNTGLVFLGPIIGAFVEPEEKKLRKQSDIAQYSVLAAGSFANIILAVLALGVLNYGLGPLQQMMVEPTGFTFEEYYGEAYPAAEIELPPNILITGLDGEKVEDFFQFNEKLSCLSPGEEIILNTQEKDYPLKLGENPDEPGKPFLGIKNIRNEFKTKEKYQGGFGSYGYYLNEWLAGFFRWLFLLSLGIGLFNLLPLPFVDGGRMLQVFLHTFRGEKKGERYYRQIIMFFLLVLLLNFFYPLVKNWLGL